MWVKDSGRRSVVSHVCQTDSDQERVARERRMQVGADDEGYAVRMKLKHYLLYISDPVHSRDDSPMYIFDGTFAERKASKGLSQVRCHCSSLLSGTTLV